MKNLTPLGGKRYSYEYERGKVFYVYYTEKISYDFISGKHRPMRYWSYELGEITENGFKTRLDAIEQALRLLYLRAKARA